MNIIRYIILFLIFLGLEYSYFSFVKTNSTIKFSDMIVMAFLFIIFMAITDTLIKRIKTKN